MDNLELVSFQIISSVGVAKSFYIEEKIIAEKGDFYLDKEKIKQKTIHKSVLNKISILTL